jgi:hypothetical protein
MPSQLDTSELRQKVANIARSNFEFHTSISEKGLNEIVAHLEAHIQQEVESARIEERGHTCKLINDLRYQVVTLDFAKELSLERLTTLQVEQEMRLIQTNSPPAEQEAHIQQGLVAQTKHIRRQLAIAFMASKPGATASKQFLDDCMMLIEANYLPKAQVEAAIGENETPTELGNYWNVGRNQLRADIREKLGLKKG